MKSGNFIKSEFGFDQPMTIALHIEWLDRCGMDHLVKKYSLPETPSEEQLALAKWNEHREYLGYMSMPLCFEGDTPSSGMSGYSLN